MERLTKSYLCKLSNTLLGCCFPQNYLQNPSKNGTLNNSETIQKSPFLTLISSQKILSKRKPYRFPFDIIFCRFFKSFHFVNLKSYNFFSYIKKVVLNAFLQVLVRAIPSFCFPSFDLEPVSASKK